MNARDCGGSDQKLRYIAPHPHVTDAGPRQLQDYRRVTIMDAPDRNS
jgi:hypothetical protein